MRLSSIVAMAAMAIAPPALADTNATGAPARADPHASVASVQAQGTPSNAALLAMHRRHGLTVAENPVDINSASRKELMKLPGIGTAEADRIIANRPYLVKTDLVSKNVLLVGPFLSIKHHVIAMPTAATKAMLKHQAMATPTAANEVKR